MCSWTPKTVSNNSSVLYKNLTQSSSIKQPPPTPHFVHTPGTAISVRGLCKQTRVCSNIYNVIYETGKGLEGNECVGACVCLKHWITAVSLSPPQGLSNLSNSVLLMSCGPVASAFSYIPPVFFPQPSSFGIFSFSHRTGGVRFFFFFLKHVHR